MKDVHPVFNSPTPHGHYVQFYKADEPLLNRNVASFLWEGLLRGDGLLVIATPQRRESIAGHLAKLGADVSLARREGQLAMLDAHAMLAQFMIGGQPDWEAFQNAAADVLSMAVPRTSETGLCAYGEMVGILWEEGRTDAALRLEEYWNRLLLRGGIKLFCGYPIDVFADGFHHDSLHGVLCAHTHVLPTGANGDLADALNRAMEDLLGPQAPAVRSSMKAGLPAQGFSMPPAETAILWLRSNLPDLAENILTRAQSYYAVAHAAAGEAAHS